MLVQAFIDVIVALYFQKVFQMYSVLYWMSLFVGKGVIILQILTFCKQCPQCHCKVTAISQPCGNWYLVFCNSTHYIRLYWLLKHNTINKSFPCKITVIFVRAGWSGFFSWNLLKHFFTKRILQEPFFFFFFLLMMFSKIIKLGSRLQTQDVTFMPSLVKLLKTLRWIWR